MNPNYLPEVTKYLLDMVPPRKPLFCDELEAYACEHQIPIVHSEVAKLLDLLVKIKQPQDILEIGTAIGYSALWLANSFQGLGKIYTIDFSGPNIHDASENLAKYDKERKIELIHASAVPYLKEDNKEYDFIFVDGKKKEYQDFLDVCLPRLSKGGIIIFDNLFWHGQVVGIEEKSERFQQGVPELREFNKVFIDHEHLESVILPVGDGLGIAVKR